MVRKVSALLAVLAAIVLLCPGAEGGLLEELGVNSVDKKTAAVTETSPCLTTERSGVAPCDTNPTCCLKDGARIPGTNYCCPPGASQFHVLSMNEFVCACAIYSP